MGRKPKQGIDYFPADVDMFQDRKIKRLLRAASGKGFTIYISLLTSIYRDKGYFYEWDEHSAFDVSDDLNFSESVVEETVKACCSIGLFNKDLFAEKSVLSSESIQQRWQKIVTDANRVDTEIDPKIKILDGKPLFLSKKTGKPPEETPEKSGGTPQSKVKDSKEKESKGGIATPPEKEEVLEYFESKGYDKPLAEKFYSYYQEPMEDRNGRVWKDSNGNTVKSWKQKAIAVWMKNDNYGQANKDKQPDTGGLEGEYNRDSIEEYEQSIKDQELVSN